MNDVIIYNDRARIGSYLVARGMERKHQYIRKLINKYKSEFIDLDNLTDLKSEKLKSTGGRAAEEILLNEDQFMFLGTLIRNSPVSVKFKKNIIVQFKKCRDQLKALGKYKKDPTYKLTRDAGKIVRLDATNSIKDFVLYAEAQGSRNANMYYVNISRMVNIMLFIAKHQFPCIRDVLSINQLMTVSSAEQIVIQAVKGGMSKKMFYKDIYQDAKKKVALFAELHGKSEVIEQCLQIESEVDLVELEQSP